MDSETEIVKDSVEQTEAEAQNAEAEVEDIPITAEAEVEDIPITAEAEVEDIPSDFFDDFNKAEFIEGLSVIDSWDDGPKQDNGQPRSDAEAVEKVKDLPELIGDRKQVIEERKDDVKKRSADRKRSHSQDLDRYIKPGSRRDPSKTNEAIKRDKDNKVKDYLAKSLESSDDIRPPGTELDDYYEAGKKKSPKREAKPERRRTRSPRERRRESPHRSPAPRRRESPRRSPRATAPRSTAPRSPRPTAPRSPRPTAPRSPRRSPARRELRDGREGRDDYYRGRRRPESPPARESVRRAPSRRSPSRRSPRRASPPRRSPRRRRTRSRSRSPFRRSYRSPESHQDNFLYPSPRPPNFEFNDYVPPSFGHPGVDYPAPGPPGPPGYGFGPGGMPPPPGPAYGPPGGFGPPGPPGPPGPYYGGPGGPPMRPPMAPPMGPPAPYMPPSPVPQPVPAPMPVPMPVPAPTPPFVVDPAQRPNIKNISETIPQMSSNNVNQTTPYDALAQLLADGKISKADYLKLTPNKGQLPPMFGINPSGSPVELKQKVELLTRCQKTVTVLAKLRLPSRLVMHNTMSVREMKALPQKFCSPLKRQAPVEFHYTQTSGSSKVSQNKQLIDSIIATLGIEKSVVRTKKKEPKTMKDAACQTVKAYCDVCEIRNSTKFLNESTSIDPGHFCASVHTQVLEEDLASSKTVFTHGGGASGDPMCIAQMTPAQLLSQLAAKAKTLKQPMNEPEPGQGQQYMRRPQNHNQFDNQYDRDGNNYYNERGGGYSNYRY